LRIPAYQIDNVLKQYTDKLTGGGSGEASAPGQSPPSDEAGFYATAKRQEIIETITRTINANVSRVWLAGRQERVNETLSGAAGRDEPVVKNGEFTPFVYNVIDKEDRKFKRTIAVTRFYEP